MKKFIIFLIVFSLLFASVYFLFQKFGIKKVSTQYDINQAIAFVKENGSIIKINTINPTGEVTNTEAVTVNEEIDQRLATGLINYWSNSWVYAPVVNSNVVINDDNTIEYSGDFVFNRALGFAKVTGISQSVIDTVSKYIKPFGASFPIYVKGTIDITDNVVNANVSQMQVSILPVTKYVNDYRGEINEFVSSQLSKQAEYNIRKLSVESGKINVDGDVPKTVEYK